MNSVSLMKRVDTKFIMRKDSLEAILNDLQNDYKVLEIKGDRLMTYDSNYFDTDNNSFYYDHHNGIAKRIKIRIRNYVESKISFLEIKQKDSQGNTVKNRIPIDTYSKDLTEQGKDFIKNITHSNVDLKFSLSNSFNRFTLVKVEDQERVTVDTNLAFNGEVYDSNLVIVELKQEKLNRNSSVFKALRKKGIRPYSISKYCIGMTKLNPGIKQNRFKHKILTINKLTG